MIQSNNLIGKKIISLFNCNTVGTITNLYFSNRKKCKFIEVLDTEQYIMDTKNILEYKSDAIVIKNTSLMQLKNNFDLTLNSYNTLLGTKVFSTKGKYIGKINLINLTDNYYINSFTTDTNLTFNKNDIFNISNNICLIKDIGNSIKLHNCKPKKINQIKKSLENISVTILKNPNNKKEQVLPPPLLKPSDTSILIDRMCTKTILSNNGEIVCKIGAKITHDIVKKCRLFGKLFELVKYSK